MFAELVPELRPYARALVDVAGQAGLAPRKGILPRLQVLPPTNMDSPLT